MTHLLLISTMACIIVFASMVIDLGAGLYKAKQRGELRRSEALKRSIGKFITYEGGMLIACGVDVLIYLVRIMPLIGCDLLSEVPVVTLLIAIFLCIVEYMSVREKADEKTHAQMRSVEILLTEIAKDNDKLKALIELLKNSDKKEEE